MELKIYAIVRVLNTLPRMVYRQTNLLTYVFPLNTGRSPQGAFIQSVVEHHASISPIDSSLTQPSRSFVAPGGPSIISTLPYPALPISATQSGRYEWPPTSLSTSSTSPPNTTQPGVTDVQAPCSSSTSTSNQQPSSFPSQS